MEKETNNKLSPFCDSIHHKKVIFGREAECNRPKIHNPDTNTQYYKYLVCILLYAVCNWRKNVHFPSKILPESLWLCDPPLVAVVPEIDNSL